MRMRMRMRERMRQSDSQTVRQSDSQTVRVRVGPGIQESWWNMFPANHAQRSQGNPHNDLTKGASETSTFGSVFSNLTDPRAGLAHHDAPSVVGISPKLAFLKGFWGTFSLHISDIWAVYVWSFLKWNNLWGSYPTLTLLRWALSVLDMRTSLHVVSCARLPQVIHGGIPGLFLHRWCWSHRRTWVRHSPGAWLRMNASARHCFPNPGNFSFFLICLALWTLWIYRPILSLNVNHVPELEWSARILQI